MSTYAFPCVKGMSWFPGHMAKGLKEATQQIKGCNCVIEVLDARIPITSRNPNLHKLIRRSHHIVVLNKSDLCDTSRLHKLEIDSTGFILTDCKLPYSQVFHQLMRQLRTKQADGKPIKAVIVGIPNVGKSSIINSLRKRFYAPGGKAASIGALPGITRLVSQSIHIAKGITVKDTPGILLPRIDSGEMLMKLAAVGTLKDHLVGEQVIAEYILHVLNQQSILKYVDVYDLNEPCYDIEEFLKSAAKRLKAYSKGGSLNIQRSTDHFIQQFRKGKLGHIILD